MKTTSTVGFVPAPAGPMDRAFWERLPLDERVDRLWLPRMRYEDDGSLVPSEVD
jgi:hypothetical protein